MSDSKFTQFLEDNPRMIGVLFSLMVFLSSTGAAAASLGTTTSGP
ncbi:uncharacterized protein HHUB_2877 [Halobacterium hubeiense]|uniref:Uncharacterized protein n=1 Tax=Halobacterium hubeiense TaxID=1407499 RepID=A0A0U5H3V7_9EURY|nr:hypothetical protein [Halobacterium hubeiense]CQH58996.1 uncharacterized protein HHUB_2877 [Halobacterium hubeiense]